MFVVNKRLVVDLLSGSCSETVHAVEGDSYTRSVELELQQGRKPWSIPSNISVLAEYIKPDGTKGLYDTLPDGTQAWSAEGNVLTLMLAPQLLTAEGSVMVQVRLMDGELQLSLPKLWIYVSRAITGGKSEDYIYLSAFLPQVEGAKAGQYFEIEEVDSAGRAVKVKAVDAPQGGSADIPETLPNPNALTFKGAVNATYDGSEAVEVTIPDSSQNGDELELIVNLEISESVQRISINEDMDGNELKLKEMVLFMEFYSPSDTAASNVEGYINKPDGFGALSYANPLFWTAANGANGRLVWVHIDAKTGKILRHMDGWTNNQSIDSSVTTTSIPHVKNNILSGEELITSLFFKAPTAFEPGTKIQIYGVKA